MKKPIASRPLEFIAFIELPVNTQQNGICHAYVAVDAATEYGYFPGVELNNSPQSVLKNIYLLTEDPEFTRHLPATFTLVMAEHEELEDQISAILKPLQGNVIFNEVLAYQIAAPLLESISRSMASDQ